MVPRHSRNWSTCSWARPRWTEMRRLLTAWAASAVSLVAQASPSATLELGSLVVTRTDGIRIEGARLVGSTLTVRFDSGDLIPVRIDAAYRDPHDARGAMLYELSLPAAQGISDVCPVAPDGTKAALLLPGTWSADGRQISATGITVACTSGAMGKCVRWGYKPWLNEGHMMDHYLACTRAVTADYCGNGRTHTRNGMAIDIYDQIGVQQRASESKSQAYTFESAWNAIGAVCVAHVRVPQWTIDAAIEACSTRLPLISQGEACTEESARAAGALIYVRSPPPVQ